MRHRVLEKNLVHDLLPSELLFQMAPAERLALDSRRPHMD